MPGETDEDTRQSLELLYALKDAKWCPLPTFFVPLEDTRLENKESATIAKLTDLQWEFFLYLLADQPGLLAARAQGFLDG